MGGKLLSQWYLIEKIDDFFGDELVKFTSPGFASFYVWQSNSRKVMKVDEQPENNIEFSVTSVAKKIVEETEALKLHNTHYSSDVSLDDALQSSSPTLLKLLSKLSTKFDNSLPSALIGNIVNGVINHQSTALQISLGVLLRDSKASMISM